ncbi:MAG: hypothetical protein Q8907_16755, partial [Bacteroidota bacterium]|nr:hypothetical protein [Bacteroidota bacterium]
KYPVTTGGRLIGIILMVSGVGLFGTFTGFIASLFTAENKNKNIEEEKEEREKTNSKKAESEISANSLN